MPYCHLQPGFTISAGFHRISVKFFIFGLHREANFGPESAWFRFQIQKYESQTLVKKNEIRNSKNEIVNPSHDAIPQKEREIEEDASHRM